MPLPERWTDENVDQIIFQEVAGWCAKLGWQIERAEIVQALSGLVADKFAQAYYELGMLYVRTQKNADARTNLQKYLELEPTGKDAATAKEMLNYVK